MNISTLARVGAVAALALGACTDLPMRFVQENRALHAIEARVHGRLGVAMSAVAPKGQEQTYNGPHHDEVFPLQSVFKAPLAAMALDLADHGKLDLTTKVTITEDDLSLAYSPIRDAWPARKTYALDELVAAAVSNSDNVAADLVLAKVGGPAALTAWLKAHEIEGISIAHYERDLQPTIWGLGPYQKAWSKAAAFEAAGKAVPEKTQRAAMNAYLTGAQDAATPDGALAFLSRLDSGALLTKTSTAKLLGLMTATTTGPNRLKAGFPAGTVLAHKTGSGPTVLGVNTATNDMGIATLPDGRKILIVTFLSASTAPEAEREKALADVARAAVQNLR